MVGVSDPWEVNTLNGSGSSCIDSDVRRRLSTPVSSEGRRQGSSIVITDKVLKKVPRETGSLPTPELNRDREDRSLTVTPLSSHNLG